MEATPVTGQVGASGSVESLTVDISALFDGFAPQAGGEGYTSTELCEMTKRSPNYIKGCLKKAIAAGVCKPGRKRVNRIDGGTVLVSSYVFQEAKG